MSWSVDGPRLTLTCFGMITSASDRKPFVLRITPAGFAALDACSRWYFSAFALSRVSGVGAAKLERYGAAFVELIAAWES